MIKFIDNGNIIGWYFFIDGCYLVDGTKTGAYKAKEEYYKI